jgi:hypothetical protein
MELSCGLQCQCGTWSRSRAFMFRLPLPFLVYSTVPSQRRGLIVSSTGSQLYAKRNSHLVLISKLTKSRIAQLKGVPLIRSPHHTPALPSALPSGRPRISIPKDNRSEGLQTAKNRRRTRKKRTEPGQRKSFITRHPAMTAD